MRTSSLIGMVALVTLLPVFSSAQQINSVSVPRWVETEK